VIVIDFIVGVFAGALSLPFAMIAVWMLLAALLVFRGGIRFWLTGWGNIQPVARISSYVTILIGIVNVAGSSERSGVDPSMPSAVGYLIGAIGAAAAVHQFYRRR